jgi:hypothetical protein
VLAIDSDVAIAWFTDEPASARADALLTSPIEFCAPDIALAEIANGLRRKQRLQLIEGSDVLSAVTIARDTFTTLFPTADLITDALRLSQSLNHSVYDCLYVVACRLNGVQLVTLDRRLIAKLSATPDAARIVHLDDWSRP